MPQRRGHGGRPKLREPDPGEKITISVRITPEMKRHLDETAEQSGRSQSQEAEFRLERSFDRTNLLGQSLELAYGRQLAGLLLMLGTVMHQAACMAGRNPVKDDWLLDAEAYWAARSAAWQLLHLWQPRERREEAASVSTTELGFASVQVIVTWLDVQRKNSTRKDLPDMMLEFLGPVAEGMIKELPKWKEAHEDLAEWEARTKAAELKKKVS